MHWKYGQTASPKVIYKYSIKKIVTIKKKNWLHSEPVTWDKKQNPTMCHLQEIYLKDDTQYFKVKDWERYTMHTLIDRSDT